MNAVNVVALLIEYMFYCSNRSKQRRGYRDGVLLTAPMQSSD
jgi:hypothetical protein